MSDFDVSTNFFEIVCGTTNTMHPLYREAANDIDTASPKGMTYLKNFLTSIETMAKVSKDSRISESKGNLKSLKCFESLNYSIDFLKKQFASSDVVKSIVTTRDQLIKFQPQYSSGYDKSIRLIELEYESFTYALISVTSLVISECMEVAQERGKFVVKSTKSLHKGPFQKSIIEAAKHLTKLDHKEYLETLIKASDDVPISSKVESVMYTENVVEASINLVSTLASQAGTLFRFGKKAVIAVKNSVFGIVPLIRSIFYLKYKKKADTIAALEEQAAFLQQNIDRLNKITDMDPEKKEKIIKKQQATIEAYRKKSEKLRAQLTETEKDAVKEQKAEDPKIKDTSSANKNDDDFVLENGMSISEMFGESSEDDFYDEALFTEAKMSENSKKIIAIPLKGVGGIKFGTSREDVRKKLGEPKTEFKKTSQSKNTTDDFGFCHVYYDDDDKCIAIELFGNKPVYVKRTKVIPATLDEAKSVADDFENKDGWISRSKSIGLTVSNGQVKSVLFGKPGYYD